MKIFGVTFTFATMRVTDSEGVRARIRAAIRHLKNADDTIEGFVVDEVAEGDNEEIRWLSRAKGRPNPPSTPNPVMHYAQAMMRET